ncbi:MAG: phosphonate C-P lyase system protein PhnL [Rhodospirillales bacterium]
MTQPMISATSVSKTFILHNQGGVKLPVLKDVDFSVRAGECVVLRGPSGAGKSTLLRALYANYRVDSGHIQIRHGEETVDIAHAAPHRILDVRRDTIGYVSQFLRVIPRVSARDVVAEPLRARGRDDGAAARAEDMLARLRIPNRLWNLPPNTFSGGEQQRVNIARSFILDFPVLLLDEPTASLDEANRDTVIDLIKEAKARRVAVVGIFHDAAVREAVASREVHLEGGRIAA